MATAYTSILKLALPVQGELSGTWGDVVNDNITSMVEEAIAGRAVINTWTTNSHTLTSADGTTSESRCAMLEFTDTGTALTGDATVVCPTAAKIYICKNDAGQKVTIKTSAGTGVDIADGQTMFVFCDGTNVVEAVTSMSSLKLGTAVTSIEVTSILDEDDLVSDSATALATQQSIKAYVDAQVTAQDLDFGGDSGTGSVDLDSQTFTIAGTSNEIETSASGQTLTVGLPAAVTVTTSVTTPTVQTTNLNANDGTTAVTIADSTGQTTITDAVLTTADINGGTADNVVIGGTTAAAGSFTTVGATGNITSQGQVITNTINEQTATSGVTIDSVLLKDGGATFTADVSFGDNDKAIFGAGSDLQIYHDGSNSYIDDAGTGNLTIRANQINFDKYTGEAMARFRADGNTELFYDNAAKLATTSTGIDVTGTVTADGLTVDGTGLFTSTSAGNVLEIKSTDTGAGSGPDMIFYREATGAASDVLGKLRFYGQDSSSNLTEYAFFNTSIEDASNGTEDGKLTFNVISGGSSREYLSMVGSSYTVFNEGGLDIDFRVESDNQTHMLFVDAGNDRVGISDSAPTNALSVAWSSAGHGTGLDLRNEQVGGYGGSISWYSTRSDDSSQAQAAQIRTFGEENWSSAGTASTVMQFRVIKDNLFYEKFRLSGTEAVFNEDSRDTDFRVESDSNTHAFFLEASTGNIGIGNSSPINSESETITIGARNVIGEVVGQQGLFANNCYYNVNWYAPLAANWSVVRLNNGTISFHSGANSTANAQLSNMDNTDTRLVIKTDGVVFNEYGADTDFRVESNVNTHMLFVDASNDHVNIGTSADYGAALNVFTTGTNGLSVVSDNGNADAGPYIDIKRKSSSPADGDLTGVLRFIANNDAAETSVGSINTVFDDVSNGSEDSSMFFKIRQAGAQPNVMDFSPTETIVNNDSFDRDFRVESDNATHMLFVDAGRNQVNIGTSGNFTSKLTIVGNKTLSSGIPTNQLSVIDESSMAAGVGGAITLWGNYTTGGADAEGASIEAIKDNATSGNYGFGMKLRTRTHGSTMDERLTLSNSSTVFNENGFGTDFRVESDSKTHMLFVDASNDAVQIGANTSQTQGALDVGFFVDEDTTNVMTIRRGLGGNNTSLATGFGFPYLTIGGSEYTSGGNYRGIGFGYWIPNSGYASSRPPAEIAFFDESVASGTKGSLVFGTRDTTVGGDVPVERMRIHADGKVTINDTGTDSDFRVESDSQSHMLFVDAGNSAVLMGASTAASGGFNSTTKFVMNGTSSYVLGLRTTNNTSTGLALVNFRDGDDQQMGQITGNASANTVTYGTTSDRSLKENDRPIPNPVDRVKSLNPVLFDWISDGSSSEGFIAQELEQDTQLGIDAVAGEDGEKNVDYGKLTPLLTAALQEALAKIESLEARITALENA